MLFDICALFFFFTKVLLHEGNLQRQEDCPVNKPYDYMLLQQHQKECSIKSTRSIYVERPGHFRKG